MVFSAIMRPIAIPTPSITARSTAQPIALFRIALAPPRTAREPPVVPVRAILRDDAQTKRNDAGLHNRGIWIHGVTVAQRAVNIPVRNPPMIAFQGSSFFLASH